ncbi:MAG: glycerate kinase [Spirochaetota bacterium]|nr:MAG: glycerate kinase [Spirochaetota bacterium]
MEQNKAHHDLNTIFSSALERVDPYKMVKEHITIDDNCLKVSLEDEQQIFDLDGFDSLYVIGAGKASAKMAAGVEELLGERITKGIISVKYGHTHPLKRIKLIEAGHPVPDGNSIEAAENILRIAEAADERSIVISLISGGGSALLVKPIECTIENKHCILTLQDIQKTTSILLSCGATIQEINCIRKHLSGIKGGRLARRIAPALQVNLILSDVIGDNLDAIASGLTTYDNTTYGDALNIIKKYDIEELIPKKVKSLLHAGANGEVEETAKKGEKLFEKVHNILIGTNYHALLGASKQSNQLGYNTLILSSQITGEAKEVAKVLFGVAMDIKSHGIPVSPPACIISGGETTVTLHGSGKGGRNTELALSFLQEMQINGEKCDGIYFLSAATDGNDGPTDAAGAYASTDIVTKSMKKSMRIDEYLKNNDSYNFFDDIDGLLKTGPTNTNVCDIQLLMVT